MKKIAFVVSVVGILSTITFLFIQCEKSDELTDTSGAASTLSEENRTIDRGGTEIDLGCTSCTDIEWKISCPQTCTGDFYDRAIVKLFAKQWNHYSNCCDAGLSTWYSWTSPVDQWMDLPYAPVISAMNAVCDPAFTAFLSGEGYIFDTNGNPTLRIPGKVYVQTRRKGDTSGATLRSHEILLNQDLTSCTPSSEYNPAVQTIIPITITNGCVVTSTSEIANHPVRCDLSGGGSGG